MCRQTLAWRFDPPRGPLPAAARWLSSATPCPAGRFGSTSDLVDAACSGPCFAGYYCDEGSSNPKQHECGSADAYCPEGDPTIPVLVK